MSPNELHKFKKSEIHYLDSIGEKTALVLDNNRNNNNDSNNNSIYLMLDSQHTLLHGVRFYSLLTSSFTVTYVKNTQEFRLTISSIWAI